MESTSGNGKTPRTAVTSTDNGLQQNGSATTRDSSNRSEGKIHHQQNGSSSSAKLHRSSKTANVTTSALSSTSLSLPTPATSAPIAGSSSISSSWARFTSSLPLRILVLKDLVGAIIGRGGGTIKQITQETHARVDVHRKESSASNENVIMIYGNPENCSQACRRILEVMQQEAKSLNRPDEISLKILASNNLIGRIIGKGGNTIKRIMQQTDTKITISSANLASQFQLERIITILGQLDNMCKAEVVISQKLRQCFESDYAQYQQSLMYTGFHSSIPPLLPPGQSGPLGLSSGYVPTPLHTQPAAPMSSYPLGTSPTCSNLPPTALVGRSSAVLAAAGSSVSSPTSSATGPSSQTHSVPPTPTQGPAAFFNPYNLAFMYPPHSSATGNIGTPFGSGPTSSPYMNINYLSPMLPNFDNIKEVVTIFIPNSVVGAIIGRGGSTIREMMSNSGAVIKVAQMNEEESTSPSLSENITQRPLERRVTIYGNPMSQYHAQFYVFQKVFTELSHQFSANPQTNYPYGDLTILKVEIMVPTNQVRRIIGKNGSVITDLQRTSGATIKLSKENNTGSSPGTSTSIQTASPNTGSNEEAQTALTSPNGGDTNTDRQHTAANTEQEMTSVFIIGDFYASYSAQRQIRSIVYRSTFAIGAALSTFVPSNTISNSQQTASKSTTATTTTTTAAATATKYGTTTEETLTSSDETKQPTITSTTSDSTTTNLPASTISTTAATNTTNSSSPLPSLSSSTNSTSNTATGESSANKQLT